LLRGGLQVNACFDRNETMHASGQTQGQPLPSLIADPPSPLEPHLSSKVTATLQTQNVEFQAKVTGSDLRPEKKSIKHAVYGWNAWFLDLPAMERNAILRADFPDMSADELSSLRAAAKRHKINAAQQRQVFRRGFVSLTWHCSRTCLSVCFVVFVAAISFLRVVGMVCVCSKVRECVVTCVRVLILFFFSWRFGSIGPYWGRHPPYAW
jgi:hypothetical protein